MNKKYVFLGDSLTFGYGVKKKDNWVTLLKSNFNLNIINKGINGNSTTDMLFRFTDDVINNNPNELFIMGGTNDLLLGKTIETIINNIELMIKESLSNNISVIIGIPPTIISEDASRLFMSFDTYDYCENNLYTLREKLINLCIQYELKYLDFYTITMENKNNGIFNDGIHLNPKGQNLLFNEAITKLLTTKV